jgi:hypothetical protein
MGGTNIKWGVGVKFDEKMQKIQNGYLLGFQNQLFLFFKNLIALSYYINHTFEFLSFLLSFYCSCFLNPSPNMVTSNFEHPSQVSHFIHMLDYKILI